jgi:predicted RNA-binding protein YlqC (UPF0109 family)
MPEDIECDPCNFLLLALESLIETWGELSVTPLARSGSTIFQIELARESLEQLLANNGRILQALQILISARGIRHRRDFRIGFADRSADPTGNSSGTS